MSNQPPGLMPATSGTRPLSQQPLLPLAEAIVIFRDVVTQTAAIHRAGRIHGQIAAERILLDQSMRATLLPNEGAEIVFSSDTGDSTQWLPPEMQSQDDWRVPLSIPDAREALSRGGNGLDPRRIDLYQLGALLCWLASAQEVGDYLRSPRARGKVPANIRPMLDRALGYDPADRFEDCHELESALLEELPAQEQSAATKSMHDRPTPKPTMDDSTAEPAARAEPSSKLPFERLGPYEIIRRIGGGGMGDVYQGFESALDRHVAIKVLPPELARHEDFVRRFRAEATAVAKLVHPNVVQIHAIGEDAGHHYFAMQFVRGESLANLIESRGQIDVGQTLSIAEQALSGLAAAHKCGLIHRDIKPGNLLMDHDHDRVLVADFGLVKGIGSEASMTATGMILGTVDYIPPEQARGHKVDGRSDLYSVGVLLYQMLAGQLPFTADSPTGMIFQHAYEQPTPLSELAPQVPKRVAAIVARLMAKDPAMRHQSAEDVIADIRAYREGRAPAASASATKSVIIAAPKFDLEDDLAPGRRGRAGASTPRRQGWRDRFAELFQAHAPEAVKNLQNTQQQVDGAVDEYERRRNKLARLVHDAEAVAAELAAQVASHREAATEAAARAKQAADPDDAEAAFQEQDEYERVAADFEEQLAEQQQQSQQIQQNLSKVEASLLQLRSQRDVLKARLRTAEARMAMEGIKPVKSFPWRAWALPGGAALLMLFAVLLAGWLMKSGPPSTPVAAIAPAHKAIPDAAPASVVPTPPVTPVPAAVPPKPTPVAPAASADVAIVMAGLVKDAAALVTFEQDTVVRDGDKWAVKDVGPEKLRFGFQYSKDKPTIVPGVVGEGLAAGVVDEHLFGQTKLPSGDSPGSIAAWFRREQAKDSIFARLGNTREGGNNITLGLRGLNVWSAELYNNSVPSQIAWDDRWHHHGATYDGKVVRYYFDGKLAAEKPAVLDINGSALAMGRSPGTVDEVALFGRAIADREMEALYLHGRDGFRLDQPYVAGKGKPTDLAARPQPAPSPAPASFDTAGLREVCKFLVAKENPEGLASDAIGFSAPDGGGRSGARGLVVPAGSGWEKTGTQIDFTYMRSGSAFGVFVIHPLKKGHVYVNVLAPNIATAGQWAAFGWNGGQDPPITVVRTAAADELLKGKDLTSYKISSRLDGRGNYRLYVDGQLVAGARLDDAAPLNLVIPKGHRPPNTSTWAELKFAGEGLPQVLLAGMAGVILGPLDNGGNSAAEVRVGITPPAAPNMAGLPDLNAPAAPKVATAGAGLVGRVAKSGVDLRLSVNYEMGKMLRQQTVLTQVFKAGGEMKGVRITLTGNLHLDKAMSVLAWHVGGSSNGGVDFLFIDDREVGSVGDDREKNVVYQVPLEAGDHVIRWVLTGGDFGANLLQFFDAETKQPLPVVASADDTAAAQLGAQGSFDNFNEASEPLPEQIAASKGAK